MEIIKAAGIIIKDRKLLLYKGKDKDTFVAPGGKLKGTETPEKALARELKEELDIEISGGNLETFGTFSAEAATNPGETLVMTVFVVKAWRGQIKANEVGSEIFWVTSKVPPEIKVGSIFAHEVLPRLKASGLID
ncbi:MAG: NUDIX domain-containing protein [Patescibacteria group bacterium]